MFIAVPMIAVPMTAHATSSNSYVLEVWCSVGGSGAPASAGITFLGQTVSITCTSGGSNSRVEFQSLASGLFSATAVAGTRTHSAKGFFGPYSCFAEGEQYDPAHSSWARWLIYDVACED